MGQQQLLLLVLGIVIVGLAVVVGIQAFDESAQQAESDGLTMDAMRILNAAKAIDAKPAEFGGFDSSADNWTDFVLATHLPDVNLTTANGTCALAAGVTPGATLAIACTGVNKVATVTHTFATNTITTAITDAP